MLAVDNIDLARAKSEAPINKFIFKSNNKLVIHKSVNFIVRSLYKVRIVTELTKAPNFAQR